MLKYLTFVIARANACTVGWNLSAILCNRAFGEYYVSVKCVLSLYMQAYFKVCRLVGVLFKNVELNCLNGTVLGLLSCIASAPG